ncbi:imidazolonepropionase [Endozoicomonas sp. (ex Bugula neritina AB1)]|nr:imidazolonepropionase [Endozoicomonas sp. (ex Bugula neritina AB1)]
MIKLKNCDKAWINVNLATMNGDRSDPYGLLYKQALGVKDGRIVCFEPMSGITATRLPFDVIDAHNGWMTPGLIDCHTHMIYAGQRSQEFEQLLTGISPDIIARQGGGVLSTVRATRVRSIAQLVKCSLPRLQALCSEGTTTVEIKSSYGLSYKDELKILLAAEKLKEYIDCRITNTLLTTHILPPEFAGRPSDYINMFCTELIPEIARRKLADAVDIYFPSQIFTLHHCRKILEAAKNNGLAIKGHMEHTGPTGGTSMIARMGALSCDHLEYLDEQGVNDMAQYGTVAVLLPGSFYIMRGKQVPPVNLLRQYDIPIAIATDLNPGTAPLASIRLMMNMACVLFRLTPAEALAGVTRNAARALGLQNDIGMIKTGYLADLCLWNIEHPAELSYQLGASPLRQRIISGRVIE